MRSKEVYIAFLAVAGIVVHLVLRFAVGSAPSIVNTPLLAVLIIGGSPLVYDLFLKLIKAEFGSDLLAGISIVTSIFLGEYLAGSFVVLMLSGGTALENYAVRRASFVLEALAKRMPRLAHKKKGTEVVDVSLDEIAIDDPIIIFPHEICPVDGTVTEGHGVMDESYLTGEPFMMSKGRGSEVLSGAINGESALTIKATKLPADSRYAKIMEVMKESAQKRPHLRRLGDSLGAIYTPIAVGIAILAWAISHEPVRFLAVLVVATPCPLLIAIPVCIIGAISLSARRGIIIKNPIVLEQIKSCTTMILDKTGTLTYGRPNVSEVILPPGITREEVLQFAASLEKYSKHPLAGAICDAAQNASISLLDVSEVSEKPGEGLIGTVQGKTVLVSSAQKMLAKGKIRQEELPPGGAGLECIVLIDDHYAATIRFRDEPRGESKAFVGHLGPNHNFNRVLLVSGDRESEVSYLAERVGITEVHARKSPEEKVAIVREETKKAKTLFIGDGINDAPALMTATVGIAFGQASDITTEAAGAVILDASLIRVDELFHISERMRRIALQSAVGGMILSIGGMVLAAFGFLPPVSGAITQEVIDLFAVGNALRVSFQPKALTDF